MISPYFKRHEFACKCGCGFDTVDAELLTILEDIRAYFNQPVIINSACRCRTHNINIGGSQFSQHMRGRAADIRVSEVPPDAVQDYLLKKYPGKYGIGTYKSFTHIDTRGRYARWEG